MAGLILAARLVMWGLIDDRLIIVSAVAQLARDVQLTHLERSVARIGACV